ncbi:MAG: DUF998 domain-containing protein [Euryarchaeota archaeon]|nr:DUF998 domain-containing protein [Euryarchaeota archaeon]
MNRKLLLGFAGPSIIFAGIATAAYINRSWWNLTDHAISDLGHVGLPYNYVLNVPIIIGALLTMLATYFLSKTVKGSITRFGVYAFMFALIFLLLIGVFPEGTLPHGFVSHAFFYSGIISMMIVGSGYLWEKESSARVAYGIIIPSMVGASLAVAALAHFPGVAIAEFVAAGTIMIAYFFALIGKLNA